MLRQKLDRLTSDFASQVIGALRSASLEELAQLAGRTAPAAAAAAATGRVAKKPRLETGGKTRAPKAVASKPAKAAKPVLVDDAVARVALGFFAERGNRGATSQQLSAHLEELGLPASADVVRLLAERGAIRDSGFRRAAGKNATAPVFVLAA